MERKNLKFTIFIIIFCLILQTASAAENEYGIVKAWFNGENATVEGVRLKIGEPVEVKVEIRSKISGNVYTKLKEPGFTKAFDVISGPGKQDDWIDNPHVDNGWSKTYAWTIAPNGAWTNGNAPLNVFVQFSKQGNDKYIQFTIANPYILDEQYTGAAPAQAQTAAPAGTVQGAAVAAQAKSAPFPPVLAALAVLLWWYLACEHNNIGRRKMHWWK